MQGNAELRNTVKNQMYFSKEPRSLMLQNRRLMQERLHQLQ